MRYTNYVLSSLLLLFSAITQASPIFIDGPAFSQFPSAAIAVECPEIGPSGSSLTVDHTQDGTGRFPGLTWLTTVPDVAEYLLISEDPDAPLSQSVVHGLYYAIPPDVTGITSDSLKSDGSSHSLQGGFKYGQNRGGNIYLPPSPMEGHGRHRYFFEVVALNKAIDWDRLSEAVTVDEISTQIEGKVAGWGLWMGVYER